MFLLTGGTEPAFWNEAMAVFESRLKHYARYKRQELPALKLGRAEAEVWKAAEAEQQLKCIQPGDFVVLLTESGEEFTSRQFAQKLQKWQNASPKRLLFIVGGAFGFHEKVLEVAEAKLSLSPLTFSHQLVRVVFLEQLYRAFTLLNNQPYHND